MRSYGRWMLWAAAVYLAFPATAPAQTEGDYLYNVTLLRAAPGHFDALRTALEESLAVHEAAGDPAPFWIRHSQGDHWDFMLIYPMDDFASSSAEVPEEFLPLVAFREEWFARSVDPEEMARRFDGMGLFHVEMFAGLPGKRGDLLEQRRMENRYYEHLGRQQNLLFVREAGPNWDAMTIGFFEDLQAFAEAGTRHSDAEQDEAARLAGFDGVSQVGPYLRSLIDYHQDTLGVPAR